VGIRSRESESVISVELGVTSVYIKANMSEFGVTSELEFTFIMHLGILRIHLFFSPFCLFHP